MSLDNVVSNMQELYKDNLQLDKRKVGWLAEYLAEDVAVSNGQLVLSETKCSKNLLQILTLVCSEGDNLLLDEPDVRIFGEKEVLLLYNIICNDTLPYSKVYISTHREFMLECYPDVYTTDGVLLEQVEGDIDEYTM